jgi:O-antigen/teichoic acid export membrane protein
LGLAKRSLTTFLSMTTVVLIRFPLGILTARFLGPEGKGLYHLIFLSVVMCAALGELGLGPASIYFIGRDRKLLPKVLGNLFLVVGSVSLFLNTAGFLFLVHLKPQVYASLPAWIWLLVGLLVPLQILESLLMQVLSAVLRIKEISIIEVAAILFQLLLFLLLVGVMGLSVQGALLAYGLQSFLTVASYFLLILRHGGIPSWPDLPLLRESLWFGIKSYLSNLMKYLNFRLDAFLVAGLSPHGIQATGVYSVAVSLAEMLLFIPRSIRRSLFPMVAASNDSEANRITSTACRHTMLLSLLAAAGVALFGPLMIHRLYGSQFVTALVPLFILLPGIAISSQSVILYGDLAGRGKPEVGTMSTLAGLVATVALDFVLIPSYGITGAAAASTFAYTLEFLVAGIFFIRYTGMSWSDVFLFRRSDLRYYAEFSTKLSKNLSYGVK